MFSQWYTDILEEGLTVPGPLNSFFNFPSTTVPDNKITICFNQISNAGGPWLAGLLWFRLTLQAVTVAQALIYPACQVMGPTHTLQPRLSVVTLAMIDRTKTTMSTLQLPNIPRLTLRHFHNTLPITSRSPILVVCYNTAIGHHFNVIMRYTKANFVQTGMITCLYHTNHHPRTFDTPLNLLDGTSILGSWRRKGSTDLSSTTVGIHTMN